MSVGRGVQAEVRRLARLWRVPLADVDIQFSTRFRTAAGSADARRNRVSISAAVAPRLVPNVLRHELAHIAAYRLVGKAERHHGPTWQGLVRKAGGDPSTRILLPLPRRPKPSRYLHACPVCDFARFAKSKVTRWRCADCVAAGLPGTLVITRMDP